MTDITNEILITAGFLSALILAWALIWRFRGGIGAILPQQRAITCLGATALGTEARAFVIQAEGRKMLVVAARRGGVKIMPLPGHADAQVDAHADARTQAHADTGKAEEATCA